MLDVEFIVLLFCFMKNLPLEGTEVVKKIWGYIEWYHYHKLTKSECYIILCKFSLGWFSKKMQKFDCTCCDEQSWFHSTVLVSVNWYAWPELYLGKQRSSFSMRLLLLLIWKLMTLYRYVFCCVWRYCTVCIMWVWVAWFVHGVQLKTESVHMASLMVWRSLIQ